MPDPRVVEVTIPVHSLTITSTGPIAGPLGEIVAELRTLVDEIKTRVGHSACDGWRTDDGQLFCGCGSDLTELAQERRRES